ncbi:hypothetical protein AYI69_g2637 [Smittium culicis]|nr:hypothetical protein AYI69_g2637 [Smittium culicis]
MKQIKTKYNDIESFINESIISKLLTENAQNIDGIIDFDAKLYLKKNDFPYALEPNIDHLLLWSTNKLQAGHVPPPHVKSFISKHLGPETTYLWLVNPPHLQSIPGVYHGHLFVKKY